jgi:hypothetical protein
MLHEYPETITRNAAVCEAEGCDSWTREPEHVGFVEAVWGAERIVFCSIDHLLRELARRSTPMETFDA